jgi:hypothetical protein
VVAHHLEPAELLVGEAATGVGLLGEPVVESFADLVGEGAELRALVQGEAD